MSQRERVTILIIGVIIGLVIGLIFKDMYKCLITGIITASTIMVIISQQAKKLFKNNASTKRTLFGSFLFGSSQ